MNDLAAVVNDLESVVNLALRTVNNLAVVVNDLAASFVMNQPNPYGASVPSLNFVGVHA